MFSKKVVNSARFLRLPAAARLLYYDLGMNADDDGVVEAYTVLQMDKVPEKNLQVLADKGFVHILNRDLVTVICDWRVNNLIKKDRYHASIYKALLDGTQSEPGRNPDGTHLEPESSQGQVSQGQVSLVKSSQGAGTARLADDEKEIFEFYESRFGGGLTAALAKEITGRLDAGVPAADIVDALGKASRKRLDNPGGYCLTVIRNLQPAQQTAPAGELAAWEQDWLDEMRRNQEGQHAEQSDFDRAPDP